MSTIRYIRERDQIDDRTQLTCWQFRCKKWYANYCRSYKCHHWSTCDQIKEFYEEYKHLMLKLEVKYL